MEWKAALGGFGLFDQNADLISEAASKSPITSFHSRDTASSTSGPPIKHTMATSLLRCLLQPSRQIAIPLCAGSHLRRFISTWHESELSNPSSNGNTHTSTAATETPSKKEAKRKPKSRFTQNNTGNTHNKGAANSKNDPLAQNDSSVQHNPDLYRLFFRSPDKIRSLEDAQVFVSHIKTHYGPLTQYQFSRCPETKKYFGYGFLTFKHKESLDKALQDGYIRVGLKDFELIRSGHMPFKRGVLHKNYGFSGFNNLEELRAKKAAHQQQLQTIGSVEEGTDASSATLPLSSNPTTTRTTTSSTTATVTATFTESTSEGSQTSEPFVSALNSTSSTTFTPTDSSSTPLQQQQQQQQPSSSPADSTSSKPFFVPLRKRGMVQLWKTIPDEIERAERTSKQSKDGEEQSEDSPLLPSSKDMAAQAVVGDGLDKNA
ncbi:hypothetical protein KVV02_001265 [Mortierella alpina]|uniref:RRM domain-containing protein n=1 Tax=Mortierella alpina TaxID=64518 RepID=A0A9P8CVY9_MORAP|nr:hypothetical protein KVV02_001265 [Mortierella alpina]